MMNILDDPARLEAAVNDPLGCILRVGKREFITNLDDIVSNTSGFQRLTFHVWHGDTTIGSLNFLIGEKLATVLFKVASAPYSLHGTIGKSYCINYEDERLITLEIEQKGEIIYEHY